MNYLDVSYLDKLVNKTGKHGTNHTGVKEGYIGDLNIKSINQSINMPKKSFKSKWQSIYLQFEPNFGSTDRIYNISSLQFFHGFYTILPKSQQ